MLKKIFEFLLVILCLAVFAGAVYYLIVLHPATPLPEPAVNNAVVIVSTEPAQLLVIYPAGQKTGYDPDKKQLVKEIPASKYYYQAAKTHYENGSYWLGLTDTSANFELRVIGQPKSYYSFGFYSFKSGKQITKTFSGRILSGDTAVYNVKFTPQASFPWEVTLSK